MRPTRGEMIRVYGVLTLSAIVMALPFYYMVITSLKPATEVSQPTVSLIVQHPTLKPYTDLIEGDQVLQATWNSFVIALLTTIGSMLFCTLAGYAFAKHNFPGKNLLFLTLLATMMIPGSVLLVPSFLLMRDFGWLDTWLPLIVPGLAGAFGVFLARQFISKIPNSLIESAKLDGATEPRIFASLILPLAKPLPRNPWNHDLPGLVEQLPLAADHPAGSKEIHPSPRDLDAARALPGAGQRSDGGCDDLHSSRVDRIFLLSKADRQQPGIEWFEGRLVDFRIRMAAILSLHDAILEGTNG